MSPLLLLESYPLRGYILGSRAPGTNAVGASGAINGMKRWSVTDGRTDRWTDRREGGNSGLDLEFENFSDSEFHFENTIQTIKV